MLLLTQHFVGPAGIPPSFSWEQLLGAASHEDQTPELASHFSSETWAECKDIYGPFPTVSKDMKTCARFFPHTDCRHQSNGAPPQRWFHSCGLQSSSNNSYSFHWAHKSLGFLLTRLVKKLLGPLSTEVSIKHHFLASQHLQWALSFSGVGHLQSLWEPLLLQELVQSPGAAGTPRWSSSWGKRFHTEPFAAGRAGTLLTSHLRQEHGLAVWQAAAAHLD